MTITLLDTLTGDTCAFDDYHSLYFWEEGNGSCDCNRAIMMQRDRRSEASLDGVCDGCKRFLIVACDHPKSILRDMNQNYPKKLLRNHGIIQ